MKKRIKITVLRTEYFEDIAEKYAIPDLGKCPFHSAGQVLYGDGEHVPEGMCAIAWQEMAPYAQALLRGELVQPHGTWLRDDGLMVGACPDGVRPVVFLIEPAEEH